MASHAKFWAEVLLAPFRSLFRVRKYLNSVWPSTVPPRLTEALSSLGCAAELALPVSCACDNGNLSKFSDGASYSFERFPRWSLTESCFAGSGSLVAFLCIVQPLRQSPLCSWEVRKDHAPLICSRNGICRVRRDHDPAISRKTAVHTSRTGRQDHAHQAFSLAMASLKTYSNALETATWLAVARGFLYARHISLLRGNSLGLTS